MTDPADALFSTPEMDEVFSGEAAVRGMLTFEAALARAEARAGVIPDTAATAIAAAGRVELFDVPGVYRETVVAGSPAIPLVRRLTELVEGDARRFVHWGSTSQDAIDTATVLQVRDGLDLLEARLLGVCQLCAGLAERYRQTPMAGRTLLQQALPITFGLKAARWLAMATRLVRRLRAVRETILVVQFGGAAGTLASLGQDGLEVTRLIAEELGLSVPDLPWHAERDRVADLASALGSLAGGMGKIATDVALLAQTEVAELAEGAAPGKGGSSAMPQKRNPVDAIQALAAARLAIGLVPVVLGSMLQEHERSVGAWQAEWWAVPNLFRATACAVERVHSALADLEVDPDRMRANLALAGGQIMAESVTMALARRLGRPAAYQIVQAAARRAAAAGVELRQAVLDDAQARSALSEAELDTALDPMHYLGSSDAFIDRALEAYRSL